MIRKLAADGFPSNDCDGDAVYALNWGDDDYSVLELVAEATTPAGSRNLFHRETADFAFVYSIRAIAGLYYWFALETGLLNVITVTTSFGSGTLLVNDKPHEVPLRLTLPAGEHFTLEARDQWSLDPTTLTSNRMVFRNWESGPGTPTPDPPPGARFEATSGPGVEYVAVFDREVNVTLTWPLHLEGGDGGRYAVNGVTVGTTWSGSVTAGSAGRLMLEFLPPPGDVFLQWSDGGRENPRLIEPGGDITLRGLYKNRLKTPDPPGARPAHQKHISRTGKGPGAGWGMVYESAGNIYYCASDDGGVWSNEVLMNDGNGNAGNPAVDFIDESPEGESGPTIVWEERAGPPGTIRILGRMWNAGTGTWRPIHAISGDFPAGPSAAAPAVSGDLVAWKTGRGVMMKRFYATEEFQVPGTDSISTGPALDYYATKTGSFAIAWTDGSENVRFRRGSADGVWWSSPVEIRPAPAGGRCLNADVVVSDNGTACVGWTEGSPGGWEIVFRFVDQSDVPLPAVTVSGCPSAGPDGPRPMLAHHRNDATRARDINLHLYLQEAGTVLSFLLRPGAAPAVSTGSVEGIDAETVRWSVSAPGNGRMLVYRAPESDRYPISTEPVPLGAGTPPPPLAQLPPGGGSNIGSAVTLTWECSPGAESYDLQVATNGSFTPPLVTSATGLLPASFDLTGLQPGTGYCWRVRGVNSVGAGGYSGSSLFTTSGAPPAPALAGTTVQAGSMKYPRLSWSAPSTVFLFRLYRYTCLTGEECLIPRYPALIYEGPDRAFTDGHTIVGGKLADARVYYFVKAEQGGFVSPSSNSVSYGTRGNVVWSDAAPGFTTDLVGIFPNPFNPSTTVSYTLAGNARVLLTIYNVLGERVATVFEGVEAAGSHARTWNASGAPAGVYFVELAVREEDAGGIFRHRRKLILMR